MAKLYLLANYDSQFPVFTYNCNLILYYFLQKFLRAVGLFAGSIVFMRNFGDLMAIWEWRNQTQEYKYPM